MERQNSQSPNVEDRIIVDPKIMVGKPVVRDTRIPVKLVLRHPEENTDRADLFAAFPRLTEDDVKTCITYAREDVAHQRPIGRLREATAGRV